MIALDAVTYTYPATAQPALREVSLSIPDGQFCAVIGANGAGKSTLCYALSGFIPHFFRGELSGRIRIDDVDTQAVTLAELVQRVGLVFQNPFNQMSGAKFTVREEVAFGLENLGVARAEMQTRIARTLERVGIADLADRSPFALSGGQQQRVAIASMLAMDPRVLVLDEPTSQLDPIGTREVFETIRALIEERGTTVVLAEHKLEWIAAFADRLVVLAHGRIVMDSSPRQVLTAPELERYHIGVPRYVQAARAAREIGLWPADRDLPVTLDEATEGFSSSSSLSSTRLDLRNSRNSGN